MKLQTSSLTQNQANRMLELNSMFDSIHKKYDYQIRDSWFRQKHNMDVYNAQFLSRYGFVVDQVKQREYEVLDAIQKRGQEIGEFFMCNKKNISIKFIWFAGNQNSECLEGVRFSLTSAIDYAGLNFKAIHTVKIPPSPP